MNLSSTYTPKNLNVSRCYFEPFKISPRTGRVRFFVITIWVLLVFTKSALQWNQCSIVANSSFRFLYRDATWMCIWMVHDVRMLSMQAVEMRAICWGLLFQAKVNPSTRFQQVIQGYLHQMHTWIRCNVGYSEIRWLWNQLQALPCIIESLEHL